MQSKKNFRNLISRTILRAATAALAITMTFALTVALTQSAQAQTFKVIYNFTGGADGGYPSGLTIDKAGNFYGTTIFWAEPYCGAVFTLAKWKSGWLFDTLHGFAGGSDGCSPYAPLTIGPDGSLYGTTWGGGNGCPGGCGTVFKVTVPASPCRNAFCSWKETVVYDFTGGNDGASPATGGLIFDQAGNIYGTAHSGGYYGGGCAFGGCGTVFQLTPNPQGSWTENTLHVFMGSPDGSTPYNAVILDEQGNIYGPTSLGGSYGYGTIFQLTPSGPGWTETMLYNFTGGSDGGQPFVDLIMDQAGNLYGAAGAVLFELSPSSGGWTFSVVYTLTGGSADGLAMDGAGNIYGTATGGAHGCGFVFELSPLDGGWAYSDLHDFTCSDGHNPGGRPALDATGKLYGTTVYGGTGLACQYGCGTVWEITP